MRLSIKSKKIQNLKLRKKIILRLVASFITFMLICLYLIYTPLGFNLVIDYARPILKKHNIIIHDGKFIGNLSNFKFGGVTVYTHDTTTIVKDAHITWKPLQILFGKLTIKKLSIKNVIVKVDTSKFDHDSKKTTFNFPLKLYTPSIAIEHAIVKVDDLTLNYHNLRSEVKLYNNNLYVKKLTGLAFDQKLIFNFDQGFLNLDSPYHVNANFEYKYINNIVPIKHGTGKLIGNFQKRFKVYSKGIINSKSSPIPFDIETTIKHRLIQSKINSLKINNQSISGNLEFMFSKDILWTISLKNHLKYMSNVKGKITQISEDRHQIISQSCNISRNNISLNCNVDMTYGLNFLNIDNLTIKSNTHRDSFLLSGEMIPKTNVKWTANIHKLNKYIPKINGKLISNGIIRDENSKPYINGLLSIKRFNFYDYNINALDIEFRKNTNQEIHASLRSKLINTKLKVVGIWNNSTWIGKITQLEGNYNGKNWKTYQTPKIYLSPIKFQMDEFCINNRQEFFCLSGKYKSNNDYNLNYNLKLYLSDFSNFLPIDSSDSYIYGNGLIKNTFGLQPKAFIYTHITPGIVKISSSNSSLQRFFPNKNMINLKSFNSYIDFSNNIANYNLSFKFDQSSYLNSNGNINLNYGNNFREYPIRSYLKFNIEKLSFLSPLITFPVRLDGSISGNMRLSKTLKNPILKGKTTLKNGVISLISLGSSIKNINTVIDISAPSNIKVSGEGSIKGRKVLFNAQGNYTYPFLNIQCSINGNRLNIIDIPGLNITLSPEAIIKVYKNKLHFNGNIIVNNAKINSQVLEEIIPNNSIKNDIIYEGSNSAEISKLSFPFSSNIRVSVPKKNILFEGLGLSAYLGGDLIISNRINRALTGNGKISIENGKYKKYGKTFNLDHDSNLTFTNSLLSNPELNIIAYYQIPASLSLSTGSPKMLGISIVGNLKNIEPKLISNPIMTQEDILSYIILGQPANQNGTTNNSDLSKAALLVLLSGSSNIALSQIKETLGISDISIGNISNNYMINSQLQSISTQGLQENNTAIFIGKNITDKLFISYGIGVFNGRQEVNALYQLDDKWNLRANWTTIDSGADIVYTITP